MAEFAEPGSGKDGALAGKQYQDLPVVARGILDVLQGELASPELYKEYVGRYVEMWPGRYRRMVSALDADDQEALMDAVLSVKTSAGMLGALRLQQLALTIEDAVRKQELDGVRAVLHELESCGQLTSDQLRGELSHEL